MTEDEQEALSHQHSHGFWVVPLESGAFATFTHPSGRLLRIIQHNIEEELIYESVDAFSRYMKGKKERRASPPTSIPTLEDLDL